MNLNIEIKTVLDTDPPPSSSSLKALKEDKRKLRGAQGRENQQTLDSNQ